MQDENKTDFSSSDNPEIAPFLKRAYIFLDNGEFDRADEYCEKVLDRDPENVNAYIGKLLAEKKLHSTDELANCPIPFNDSINYKNAVRFGGDEIASMFNGYIEQIRERNKYSGSIEIYNSAVNILGSAETVDDCASAVKLFRAIPGFRDADEKAAECENKAKEIMAKAEAGKLIKEQKAEERKKGSKRAKKLALIILPAVAVLTAFAVIFFIFIMQAIKYNKAIKLIEQGEKYEAAKILYSIKDYSDAKEKFDEIAEFVPTKMYEYTEDDQSDKKLVYSCDVVDGNIIKEVYIDYDDPVRIYDYIYDDDGNVIKEVHIDSNGFVHKYCYEDYVIALK